MNTNPVTQKQLEFINTLKGQNGGKTSFLSGIVGTYERINKRQGHLPEKIAGGKIHLFFLKNNSVAIPEGGELTPADIIEMKNDFDSYIMGYTPETTTDASIIIDILKNSCGWAAHQFIFDWLKQNYGVTDVINGQYTTHTIGASTGAGYSGSDETSQK
jgi:hypothetical protein